MLHVTHEHTHAHTHTHDRDFIIFLPWSHCMINFQLHTHSHIYSQGGTKRDNWIFLLVFPYKASIIFSINQQYQIKKYMVRHNLFSIISTFFLFLLYVKISTMLSHNHIFHVIWYFSTWIYSFNWKYILWLYYNEHSIAFCMLLKENPNYMYSNSKNNLVNAPWIFGHYSNRFKCK